MDADELRELFRPWRERLERLAWVPGLSSEGPGVARYGGWPEGSSSGEWPSCVHCGEPMVFLLSVDLASLPVEAPSAVRTGELQLFYCSTGDGDCPTWEPFTGTCEFRLVTDPVELGPPPGVESLATRFVSEWVPVLDAPGPEDHPGLGLGYVYDFERGTVSVSCTDPLITVNDIPYRPPAWELEVAETIGEAIWDDKIGGWPAWEQAPCHPACPICGEPMRFLLQIASNQALDLMWGDVGTAHVMECHDHPGVYSLNWSCG